MTSPKILTEQEWLNQETPQMFTPEHLELSDVYNYMEAISDAQPIKVGNKVVINRDKQVDLYISAFPKITRLFQFLLNKFVLTNMAKAKLQKELEPLDIEPITTFENFLSFLEHSATGTDDSVRKVQSYIKLQSSELQDFLIKLASKSYKTGVAITTYNKIAKAHDFKQVPDFNVQLANNIDKIVKKYDDNLIRYADKLADSRAKLALGKKIKTPTKPLFELGAVTATEKFDGVRCLAIVRNNVAKFFTRDGREITKLTEVKAGIEQLNVGNRVFDGELLVSANQGIKAEDAFRATMKIVGSKNEKLGLTYHIFDTLQSPDRFLTAEATLPYTKRREKLDEYGAVVSSFEHIEIVPRLGQFIIQDLGSLTEIHLLADAIISKGGEGIMLNLENALYDFKRTNSLLKVKQVNENDGEIVGTFDGQGDFEGLLGGVIVRYKDTTVRVGSGFSLEDRKKYATRPEQLIGQMATYAFTTESHNEKGEVSVRFPRFKAIRFDKTPADASYDN